MVPPTSSPFAGGGAGYIAGGDAMFAREMPGRWRLVRGPDLVAIALSVGKGTTISLPDFFLNSLG